jgi:glucose-1-phosphate thymidylyltransferase
VKGVILAGGRGVRLRPLTEITNKHLLPVGKEPMIWHSVRQLVGVDVQDILVVTSTEHMGAIVGSLGSGERFSCQFTYRVQEKAQGIAHALMLAEDFCASERFVTLLADNIFEHSIAPYVHEFRSQARGARVLLKQVADPQRYGIAALDERTVINITEKPDSPVSDLAVVGCYMYDRQVFDRIRKIRPSSRGEWEITAVNNMYIDAGQLEFSIVSGDWSDAGTFESLQEANAMLLKNGNKILP